MRTPDEKQAEFEDMWDRVEAELPRGTSRERIRREVEDRLELLRDDEAVAELKGEV